MSLEPGRPDVSPVSSGRSSPAPRWTNEYDDSLIQKDPRQFKKYATGVERALALFENTLQEWADYISFLGRLHKAIQSNHGLAVIPAKSVVAKRLAQCLNARLPSGVHQKALEVYSSVFSIIGVCFHGGSLRF
ncbi:hypothetical protein TWF696_004238 [Orbilia brochopaga]|uniref:DOP1 N-terminal domain-containing protein n=1 Tax=Orbilia brochopaga TaxID=3140254 RepID=A0AAV9V8C7_9PEZI